MTRAAVFFRTAKWGTPLHKRAGAAEFLRDSCDPRVRRSSQLGCRHTTTTSGHIRELVGLFWHRWQTYQLTSRELDGKR